MINTLDTLLILLGSLHSSTDPAFADAVWTATVCTLLMMAGGLAMAMLPWSDRELAQVDSAARALATALPSASKAHRATLHG